MSERSPSGRGHFIRAISRGTGNLVLPGGVLLAGWALSGWLYSSLDRDRIRYDEARFEKVITSVETRITSRFATYEEVLSGAEGLLATSERSNSKDWQIYVSRLHLPDRYPEVAGISIVQPADGDLAGDPARREAAEQARDSGQGVLTASTTLEGGSGKGWQLLVPVYRESAPVSNVAERRRGLIAWVSLVFSADDLLRWALAELQPLVSLRVYDGDRPNPSNPFFDSVTTGAAAPPAERTTELILGGKTWTLRWNRRPGFPFLSRRPSAWAAGCTAMLSLLSAGLAMSLQSTRRRAAALAAEQTAETKAGEARKTAIMDAALDPIITIDAQGCVTGFNPAAERSFGYSREQVMGQPLAELIIPAERRAAYRHGWAHALETGDGNVSGKRIELTALRADASIFPIELAVNRLSGEGLSMFTVYLRDLSERKRTEERLNILSSAVEQSPVSIIIATLDGKIEYVNERLTQKTGYTLEELKGRDARVLAAPDTPPRRFEEIGRAMETEGSWRGIIESRTKDGKRLWAINNIHWIRDSSGAPTRRLTVAIDVTERVEMEEALKLSEERFRIAAESSGDLIYEWDLRSGTAQTFGGKRDDRVGLEASGQARTSEAFQRLVHPEDRDRLKAAIGRHLTKGEAFSEEYRLLLANGTVRYMDDNGSAVRDKEGKPYKWVGVMRDVTDRKLAEQKLSQLAGIVECADAAIVGTDLSGNVITWNRGAERIYGYRAEEIIGQPVRLLIPEDRLNELAGMTEKLKRGDVVLHAETKRLNKSGALLYVLLTISPIRNAEGTVVGTSGIAWDITPMKELERQLAQAQKLESIGQLAAGIAHEINTPIQYIGDNATFLEDAFRDLLKFAESRAEGPAVQHEELPPAIDEGVLDYLRGEVPKSIGHLIEGVEQVAKIVRAMKEFSHPGPIERLPIDINRSIESTIVVSRNEWKYVADVTTDFHSDIPPVPCVAGELNQVILNLIVNAAHAIADVVKDSGRKGSIHISTDRIDSTVVIRISDTGGGIPEAIQSKIFDPFFTTKPVGRGTGQGLAIAHSVIVKKHKGSLTFESESGRGTTFVIQLPLVQELEHETNFLYR